jgi:hypothetical protein
MLLCAEREIRQKYVEGEHCYINVRVLELPVPETRYTKTRCERN